MTDTIRKHDRHNIVVLSGGVGGAKMAAGLAALVTRDRLTVVANTGDDFVHMGLTICPDIDTLMYTLSGESDSDRGWGRQSESWQAVNEVARLGGPAWFRLGDLDLATHLVRTHMLAEGRSLTEVTTHLMQAFGVRTPVLPMSDRPVPTMIETPDGTLSFQEWFVEKRWQPVVTRVILPENARAAPQVLRALSKADIVIIAPSNPFVSIDPILNVYPVRELIADLPGVVVAVSPIIGGEAVKGPAAKMMRELGLPVTARAVADHYRDLIDGFVYDQRDSALFTPADGPQLAAETWMKSDADRRDLGDAVIQFAISLL